MSTIKKSVHPRTLPGVHPGLQQRLREAEEAENRGLTPRGIDGAQKVLRPTPDVSSAVRKAQVRTVGLVDPAYRAAQDGLAAIAQQDAFRPGTDLDGIWDSLSEVDKIRAGATERFRLEMESSLRVAAMPWNPVHKLGGRLDARALKRANDNLQAEIAAYSYLLAPDSYALLIRFVDETHKLLELCLRQRAVQGIDTLSTYQILRDLIQKLIFQELSSRRRAMGDRGIRRICGNIDLAEILYGQAKHLPNFSPRERLVMRVIHVHQDIGHTAYAARASFRGGKLHRAYGARIFNDELNRFRSLLTHEELELVRSSVATHSADELPFVELRILALVRAVDHLAPFAPHRVYKHLEQVPNAADYLDDLLERARSGDVEKLDAAKAAFRKLLDDAGLHPALRDDLLAAFRPFGRRAEVVELGDWAGGIAELSFDTNGTGVVCAKLEPDEFSRRYQALFDYQQEQFARLARAFDLGPDELSSRRELSFARPGLGALVLMRP